MANGLFETPQDILARRKAEVQSAVQGMQQRKASTREGQLVGGLGSVAQAFLGQKRANATQEKLEEVGGFLENNRVQEVANTQGLSPEAAKLSAETNSKLRDEQIKNSGLSPEMQVSLKVQDTLKHSEGSPEGLLKLSKQMIANGNFDGASKVIQLAKSMEGTTKDRKTTKDANDRQRFVDTGELVFPDVKVAADEGTGKLYSATDKGGNIRYISASEGTVPDVKDGEVLNTVGTPKAGTNITLKNEGTIPTDHRAIRDKDGLILRYEVIKGSKTHRGMEADDSKRKGRVRSIARAGGTVIQDLGRMEELLMSDSTTSGLPSLLFSKIPTTNAAAVVAFGESALSNVGLDVLQNMRDNSPTGGALGQVPIQQQKRLEQVYGSLNTAQKPPVVLDNVRRLQNIYKDIVYGTPKELEEAYKEGDISSDYLKKYGTRKPLTFDMFGQTLPVTNKGSQESKEVGRKAELEARLEVLLKSKQGSGQTQEP